MPFRLSSTNRYAAAIRESGRHKITATFILNEQREYTYVYVRKFNNTL